MLVQREIANNTRTYPTDKYKLNTQGVYTKSQIDQDLSNIYQTMSTKANSADVYYLPDGGIPDTDMSAPVQTSLGKADTAVQNVDGKEDKSNKVTSISSASTDTQYPSAKCVYDLIGDVETLLSTI